MRAESMLCTAIGERDLIVRFTTEMLRGSARILLLAVAAAFAPMALAQQINAAGATFPAPIYMKWFRDYHRVFPAWQISYQPIGSGAGIRQLMAGAVDVGASDVPLSDEQMSAFRIKPLHFPTVLGGVVPIYNLAGIGGQLRFTPEVLAGIFMGTIRRWDDEQVTAVNRDVRLPRRGIVVIHRSDASGTTFVWTDYLNKVNAAWRRNLGVGTLLDWPVGIGSRGNEGVDGLVRQTPDSIGYVELSYAIQAGTNYGSVRNAAGSFLKADVASLTAAAATAIHGMPDDFRISITNAGGKQAYPIASFTWLLVPRRIEDASKRDAIREFLKWMLISGQDSAVALGYAPLPKGMIAKEQLQIRKIE